MLANALRRSARWGPRSATKPLEPRPAPKARRKIPSFGGVGDARFPGHKVALRSYT